ncbi:MAG TPA: NHL repeat-containing protein, partial [bacterium]|nr:NHL repeat-containing protein [bacterium]
RMIKVIGSKGSGSGLFNEVFGLAVDSKGNLYTADPGNKRITKFGPGPGFAFIKDKKVAGWQLNQPTWPHLAVDSQDHVIVVDSGGRKLWVYDSELNYLGTVGSPNGMDGTGSPLGVAVAADGSVWLSDSGTNRLEHLGPLNIPAKK